MIRRHFSDMFVARTWFDRVSDRNMIIQERINCDGSTITIPSETTNRRLLEHLREFLTIASQMLTKEQWIPDFAIKTNAHGYEIRNVLLVNEALFKIVDLTFYYDPFRLYKQRMEREVVKKGERIGEFLDWVNSRL